MYEAAASCKDVSQTPVTNWKRLQDTVRRETRDVAMFCYGLAARTEKNNEQNLVRHDVLLRCSVKGVDGPLASLCPSVCLSVHMEQRDYHWTDFEETLYLRFVENLSRKF